MNLPIELARIPSYFRDSEIERIFEVASRRIRQASSPCKRFKAHRDFALVAVLFYTGARISEALALGWHSFDHREGVVRIPTLKRRRKSTRRRETVREIPMPSNLSEIVQKYEIIAENHFLKHHNPAIISIPREMRPADVKVDGLRTPGACDVSRPFSMHRTTAFRRVVSILKEAGVSPRNAHPHVFRHTYATRLSHAGVPPQTLAKILGHGSLNHVMVYYHLNPIETRGRVEIALSGTLSTNKEE